MKNLISFILVLSFTNVFSQINFIGFDRNDCAQPMNNTYTFNNYSIGGGGSGTIYGYTIYKNGIAVYSASGTMSNGKVCKDLKFINDSIGFLVYYSGYTTNRVLRTEDFGQTWKDIGGGAPNYFGLYVLNSISAYLVTQWNTPQQLYVARCSSLQFNINTNFIYDQVIHSDIYKTDTLFAYDLCNKDSLNIYIKNGLDTITYHINFNLQYVGIQSNFNIPKTSFSIFPNPSSDIFQLSIPSFDIKSVILMSVNGAEIRTYDKQSIYSNSYSLYNVPNGIYFVRVKTEESNSYIKLIVNN